MNTKPLYNKKLSREWSEWVESDSTEGSRRKEIYPIIQQWIKEISPRNIVHFSW